MKSFKNALRHELNNQNISIAELSNMTSIKEQKITYLIRNISYNSLTYTEALIISNALEKDIYDICQVKGIKNINQS